MQLPLFQSSIREFSLLQTMWKSILDPIVSNLITQGIVLKNVQLQIGSNAINHGLGRALQGWVIVRKRGAAAIYDTQDQNQSPQLTLLLTSDAVVNINIEVF